MERTNTSLIARLFRESPRGSRPFYTEGLVEIKGSRLAHLGRRHINLDCSGAAVFIVQGLYDAAASVPESEVCCWGWRARLPRRFYATGLGPRPRSTVWRVFRVAQQRHFEMGIVDHVSNQAVGGSIFRIAGDELFFVFTLKKIEHARLIADNFQIGIIHGELPES